MKITKHLLVLTFTLTALLFTADAHAKKEEKETYNAGDVCKTFGETRLSSDQTSIIACLKKTADKNSPTIWKSGHTQSAIEQSCFTTRYNVNNNTLLPIDGYTSDVSPNMVVYAGRFGSIQGRLSVFPSSNRVMSQKKSSGIKCINNYQRMGCSIYAGNADNDLMMSDNGCLTDDEETAHNASIFITCCKLQDVE